MQNLGRNLFQLQPELEHRRLSAASPAGNFPMGTNKLDAGMIGLIQQQGILAAIKLLGKNHDRLRIPG
jgi:hypothetical protein